ncbi:hypothetical protein C7M84_022056 [Penaeus vannamei]|uniref:Peptidase S1 domain-containing protein n=1 Tax=Penaeus vannamei TaxID=6689 RepID=A0A423U7S4_PENVA|nr:hypothetical protein C7M84_022056 [Penaeus vannamei]
MPRLIRTTHATCPCERYPLRHSAEGEQKSSFAYFAIVRFRGRDSRIRASSSAGETCGGRYPTDPSPETEGPSPCPAGSVAECDVTVGLDNGEAALLFSRSDVRVQADLRPRRPAGKPDLLLPTFPAEVQLLFRESHGSCGREGLRVLHGRPSGDLRGRNISLSYERNVMGFNGGYVCVEPDCPACGVTVAMETKKSVSADQRIVGGVSTKKGDFPWMAHLKITASHSIEYMCGGSLVTDSLIISAAHCFEYDVLYVDVTLGMVDTKLMLASDLVRVRSTDFAMHPDYDAYNIYNDIAVIKLPKAVTFTDVIRPICLPATAAAMEGSVATGADDHRQHAGVCAGKREGHLSSGDSGGCLWRCRLECGAAPWGGPCCYARPWCGYLG